MAESGTILIVDDSAGGREALQGALTNRGYDLVFAASGPEALQLASRRVPDLVLLDVMMPEMDGLEVCRRLRGDPKLAEVPVIMITALDDRDARIRGLEAGADDFISKPFDRIELRARVNTVTTLNRYRRLVGERAKVERLVTLSPDGILVVDGGGTIRLANPAMGNLLGTGQDGLVGISLWDFVHSEHHEYFGKCFGEILEKELPSMLVETEFLRPDGRRFPAEIAAGFCNWDDTPSAELVVRDVTQRKKTEQEIVQLNQDLLSAYDATLEGWTRALDLRDNETEGHTQRVTELTERLARAMGFMDEDLVTIRRGALLHDMGKIGVPDAILLKPGPLTDEEFDVMRRHPEFAYNMLAPIGFLEPALDIPYCHHEKWDGSGYPRGLAGEDIPLVARLFAVVDVWDALRSNRPYRKAWPVDRVRAHIEAESGAHFDPSVVEVFLPLV